MSLRDGGSHFVLGTWEGGRGVDIEGFDIEGVDIEGFTSGGRH